MFPEITYLLAGNAADHDYPGPQCLVPLYQVLEAPAKQLVALQASKDAKTGWQERSLVEGEDDLWAVFCDGCALVKAVQVHSRAWEFDKGGSIVRLKAQRHARSIRPCIRS